MAELIREFRDESYLEYDEGNFDAWCIYLKRPGQARYAPKDVQYFQRLIEYASVYGYEKVYNDFVSIYNVTTKEVKDSVFDTIDKIAATYGDFEIDVAIDLSIMYMGMIAEENKAGTKLGKRIKRLGVHQVLMDRLSSREAANFSRGMGWRDIAKLCEERGF